MTARIKDSELTDILLRTATGDHQRFSTKPHFVFVLSEQFGEKNTIQYDWLRERGLRGYRDYETTDIVTYRGGFQNWRVYMFKSEQDALHFYMRFAE